MGFFDSVSDFVSNTVSSVKAVAAPVVNNPVVNPVGVGIAATTGVSPTTQLEIGAAGGLVAMAPVVGPMVQSAAGTALATSGALLAPLTDSGAAAGAGAAVATSGSTATVGGSIAAAKPAVDALKTALDKPATPAPVTTPAPTDTSTGHEMLWLTGGLLAVKFLL